MKKKKKILKKKIMIIIIINFWKKENKGLPDFWEKKMLKTIKMRMIKKI